MKFNSERSHYNQAKCSVSLHRSWLMLNWEASRQLTNVEQGLIMRTRGTVCEERCVIANSSVQNVLYIIFLS
jgi:hypothetical protein